MLLETQILIINLKLIILKTLEAIPEHVRKFGAKVNVGIFFFFFYKIKFGVEWEWDLKLGFFRELAPEIVVVSDVI